MIVLTDAKYVLNLQLELFNPYGKDRQAVVAKLGDIVHALGHTVQHPKRPVRAQSVLATCEEVYYNHIQNLPDSISLKLKGLDPEKRHFLLNQVMEHVVLNTPPRSTEAEFLQPYCHQEE